MAITLPSTKYPNNHRTVTGTITVKENDVVLYCDTTNAPVVVNLLQIPDNYWSTQYKIYIVDSGNNAATNNITINAGTSQTIDNAPSKVITTNSDSLVITVSSNSSYITNNAAANNKGNIVLFNNTTEDSLVTTTSYQTFANKSYNVLANTLSSNGDKLNIRTIIDKKNTSSNPDAIPMVFINDAPAWDNAVISTNLTMGIENCLIDIELTRVSNTDAFISFTLSRYVSSGVSGGIPNNFYYYRVSGFNFSSNAFNISSQASCTLGFEGTVYCEQLRIEKFMV
jgi:hypothetical protein